jgi:hypothetical protein
MPAKTAGTWKALNTIGVAGDLSAVDTTKLVPLGTRITARDMGSTVYGEAEFVYCSGVASTARGSVVAISGNYTTTLVAARVTGAIGLALGAVDSASKYGWYQVRGTGVALCDAGITDAAALYIDGTAGRCDDTAVAGDAIAGMRAASTDDTNTCLVTMGANPVCGDFDNA